MARETLTVQPVVRAGLAASYTAFEPTGVAFPNEGRTFMHIQKGAGATTLTIDTPGTVDGLAIAQRTVAVAATTEKFIGPFQPGVYNQTTDVVHVDISTAAATSITVMRI